MSSTLDFLSRVLYSERKGEDVAERTEGSRIVQSAGMAVALAVGMLFFDQLEAWRDRALPPWVGVAAVVAIFGLFVVPALLRRDFIEAAIGLSIVPTTIGTAVQRFADPDPPWTDPVRAAGTMLLLVVVLVSVLTSARRVRELERLLFTEATSIAFFVTVIGATAYAGLQALLDVPRLSFAWVSLFGFAVWGIAALLLRRRYS